MSTFAASWFTDAIETGGPPVLFLLMVLENVFPPIPSEAVLPVAGFFAQRGELNLPLAFAAATAGSVVGAMILYEAGLRGGRPLILRYGRVLRIDAERLDRADSWFERHGTRVVLAARVVPIARSVVSVPAGTTRMRRGPFLLYTTVGTALWNAALMGAGWLLGDQWERVSSWVDTVGLVLVALVVVGLVALWVRNQRTRSR